MMPQAVIYDAGIERPSVVNVIGEIADVPCLEPSITQKHLIPAEGTGEIFVHQCRLRIGLCGLEPAHDGERIGIERGGVRHGHNAIHTVKREREILRLPVDGCGRG